MHRLFRRAKVRKGFQSLSFFLHSVNFCHFLLVPASPLYTQWKFMCNSSVTLWISSRLPENVCLNAHTDYCVSQLSVMAGSCNSYKHYCLRKWYNPAFSLPLCVSDGINASRTACGDCMSYFEENLKSSFLLWFELLMLLHLQLLVLDDALISVSLAEAQHSGHVWSNQQTHSGR